MSNFWLELEQKIFSSTAPKFRRKEKDIPENQVLIMNTVALPVSPQVATEWVKSRKENLRPWSVFFDFKKFHIPQTFPKCTTRVARNVEHFQSNYIVVFVALILYCILTSPLLLIAIAAFLGALYIIKLKNHSKDIILFGMKLSLAHQYALVSIISFPLFYIAGAGQVVFWILGASFFTIMLHATLYAIESMNFEEEAEPFDLQMEPV